MPFILYNTAIVQTIIIIRYLNQNIIDKLLFVTHEKLLRKLRPIGAYKR